MVGGLYGDRRDATLWLGPAQLSQSRQVIAFTCLSQLVNKRTRMREIFTRVKYVAVTSQVDGGK